MSNDQIIRSSKPHEVTIPEGSNSARSIRNKLGHREVEQEREEKIAVDKQLTDKTVQVGAEALSDRQVALDQTSTAQTDNIVKVQEGVAEANRIQVPQTDNASDQRVKIETGQSDAARVKVDSSDGRTPNMAPVSTSGQEDRYVALPGDGAASDNYAILPSDIQGANRAILPTDTPSDNRAMLATDTSFDNRAVLPADSSSDNRVAIDNDASNSYRATHEDDAHQDTYAQVPAQGVSTSEPVSIPSDSIQDRFAQVPDMTHTDSPPVKVDGHGITDPSRVLVEDTPAERADAPVAPPVQPVPVPDERAEEEVVPQAPVQAAAVPEPSAVRIEPAQVSGHVVDKKAEEFRGRVVKLRDEVDQLNRRLDEIKK